MGTSEVHLQARHTHSGKTASIFFDVIGLSDKEINEEINIILSEFDLSGLDPATFVWTIKTNKSSFKSFCVGGNILPIRK